MKTPGFLKTLLAPIRIWRIKSAIEYCWAIPLFRSPKTLKGDLKKHRNYFRYICKKDFGMRRVRAKELNQAIRKIFEEKTGRSWKDVASVGAT
jgi:hypothetical protein